jgi:hypothetical protein
MFSELDALCESISCLDKSIEDVTVINKFGRPVERIESEGNDKHLPHNSEMFFMQCVLQISMGHDFDEQYGPINYHISDRQNLTMLTFPIYDHILLVTAKKDTSPISLARKITCVIGTHRKQE